MPKVFIGVGHGGSDPGAVGIVREADANLTIALEVQRLLGLHGVQVGISRIRDEDDSLTEEIRECNTFAPDLAVEIHNNAGGGDGWECYVQSGACRDRSLAAAQRIAARVKATGQQSRGIKTRKNDAGADYFGWLRCCQCPAVLLEGFFVDSPDALDYDTQAEQHRLARAYTRGILDYLGIEVQEEVICMVRYNKLDELPDWAKPTIAKLVESGTLKGDEHGNLNLSEDMVRLLAILDRRGKL